MKYSARGFRNRKRFRNAIYFHLVAMISTPSASPGDPPFPPGFLKTHKTDAPSIVDANTVLTGAVGPESLKTIAGRCGDDPAAAEASANPVPVPGELPMRRGVNSRWNPDKTPAGWINGLNPVSAEASANPVPVPAAEPKYRRDQRTPDASRCELPVESGRLSVTQALMADSSAGRLQPGSDPILVCHEAAHLCLISLLHIHMGILPAVFEQQ